MKKLLLGACAFLLANSVQAGIPLLNYKCPGDIAVHADEGGPVYINEKESHLKKGNDNYFEATGSGVTIIISINPDGSPNVSYDGKHGAHGICQPQDFSAGAQSDAASTANEPSHAAKKACKARFGGSPRITTVTPLKPGWWEIILNDESGRQSACTVHDDGRIDDWVEM